MGTPLGCQDDDGNNDWEEGTKMRGDENAFSQWQMLCTKDIECCDAKDRCKDQECCLPSGWDIGLWVVDHNQALNDQADEPAVESDNALPGDGGEPSC